MLFYAHSASSEVEQIEMQIGLVEVQADDVWRSFFTSIIRIERAEQLGSIVETLMEGIPRNVEEAKNCINSTKQKCMYISFTFMLTSAVYLLCVYMLAKA